MTPSLPPGTLLAPIGNLPLACGAVLPDATVAYVTYGRLAADGRNAVLFAHGVSSSHMHVQRGPGPVAPGSFAALVGPGAAIDTDRFFVVCPNALGSAYGSTGPLSTNPATGQPYGPDFPPVTIADTVAAQRRLADLLGITRLAAVMGISYGGFVAFEWAIAEAAMVDGLVVIASAPDDISTAGMDGLPERFARVPGWNGGRYARGAMDAAMTELREEVQLEFAVDAMLAPLFPDPAALTAELRRRAAGWAGEFDANCMIAMIRSMQGWEAASRLDRIRARTLYSLCRTDPLYPPAIAPRVMTMLREAGVAAEFAELDSPNGHLAYGIHADRFEAPLRRFMAALPA